MRKIVRICFQDRSECLAYVTDNQTDGVTLAAHGSPFTIEELATLCDKDAANLYFRTVHEPLSRVLLTETDRETATKIMRVIAEAGGLHTIQYL